MKPPPEEDFSTIEYRFIFDMDQARPLVAELLNISYDLSFDPLILVNTDGFLMNNQSSVLRDGIRYILTNQAVATAPISVSACQLIIKTITESFTFSVDLNQHKGLITGTRSLRQALVYAQR